MMAHYAARLCTVSSAELCRAAPSPIQNKTKKSEIILSDRFSMCATI